MRFLIAIAFTLLISLPAGVKAQDSVFIGNVPLPEDAAVAQNSDSPFVGVWVGKWDNWRNHILVVERLKPNGRVDVIYAASSERNGNGNWLRTEATIENDTLVFADESFPAQYTISTTGRLRGVFGDNARFAILTRHDYASLLSSPDEDWFSVGNHERLKTNLDEDDQNITLAVVIYRPPGDGPFPLALVHHGSTGTGTQPHWFKHVWSDDWFADVLNAHGWIAAFPQRRGRGGSDGLYDEGFAEDRTQGYASNATIAIAGADRALSDANAALTALRQRPDVQPGKILLSGVSRGGVVAIMQAGQNPDDTAAVINFVGGWVREDCCDPQINPTLFGRIGSFGGPILSVYGEEDAYYSIAHSRRNIAEMDERGTDSQLHIVKVPGFRKGHWAMTKPNLWETVVNVYLDQFER